MLRGPWRARRYDRTNPTAADIPNQAINHASVAVTSAAVIAVTYVGAIPQLGFIHENSGEAFALDVADLFRDTVLLPAAFQSAKAVMDNPNLDIERHTRRTTGGDAPQRDSDFQDDRSYQGPVR